MSEAILRRPPNFQDLVGHPSYGRLTVLEYAGRSRSGNALWRCRCDCGNTTVVVTSKLKNGHTQSCGCRKKSVLAEASKKHGQASSRRPTSEYCTWQNMKRRCYDVTNKSYANYGGRGIKVCDRWCSSFEAFFADMGQRPSPQHSIDRFPDNDGNYEPGNCRWAVRKEQSSNRRVVKLYTFDGKTMHLADWSRELGIKRLVLFKRLKRGWTVEEAFTTPVRGK